MGLFKNEVGRPSNETIRNRNIFKGICVVFGLIIILLVGYILNDKGIITFNKPGQNKNDNDKIVTTTKKLEEKISDEDAKKIVTEVFGNFDAFYAVNSKKLELNDDHVKTLVAILNTTEGNRKYTCKELFGSNIESFSASYGEGTWKVEDLLCSDGYQTLYSYSDVNKQYKKIFGEGKNALKDTIKDTVGGYFGSAYAYSNILDGYSFLSCECGDGFPPMMSGFKNAKKSNNILTIDYAKIITDSNGEYFTLNDGTKIKYDYTKDMREEFLKYKDRIDVVYTLVFEEQKNGSYIFIKAK